MSKLKQRLDALPPEVLRGILRGIEKEGLRVRPDGTLAQTPHPGALGSALTHESITTDFSEAQLELITGAHRSVEALLQELTQLHQFVYRNIGDELIWAASMPCRLPAEDEIPLGRYGGSNMGRLKTVYRQGLSHRYGRRMQTISGIHYNFSLPERAWPLLREAAGSTVPVDRFQDAGYFALIRNFRRHSWLLLLLLGASPAVCGSFVAGHSHGLAGWDTGSYFAPYGTSLRMGRLGYQSDAQAALAVSFNCLGDYARTLHRALTETYPAYEAIGLRDGDCYRQLATTLLQIENEFYGTIRPKRRIHPGERPLRALGLRGVEYVEVRLVDIDPFEPAGIGLAQMRLLDIFLLHCLLSDSPPDSPQEIAAMARNQRRIAERGRDPRLRLHRTAELFAAEAPAAGDAASPGAGLSADLALTDLTPADMTPAQWGSRLLRECEPIAAALDRAQGDDSAYRDALAAARAALRDFDALPSARVLREAESSHGKSFPDFALARSAANRRALLAQPLPAEAAARYARAAAESQREQRRREAADDMPFETFRQRYLAQDLMGGGHFRPL
ncbi:MAG: glutamate--cysteine ligase [Burkholderiaceae bacterium]|nr:glutamate--cysteine ligase [Burkholderiaceae bacterium]